MTYNNTNSLGQISAMFVCAMNSTSLTLLQFAGDLRRYGNEFMKELNKWLDEQIPDSLPKEVRGISFNLFEPVGGFGIEVIGASRFDEEDPDWACDECWEPSQRRLDIPRSVSGDSWEECLKRMKVIVLEYLDSGSKSGVLKTTEGIGIGFVDGDMEIVWKP